ncbi:Rad52/Rad22 family DNA repair protein [Halocella sp. SP3-1]|uniref:Rad52/Rad22 family DNA repair protein n=1 Tax=Halocella sp. SP3-1 TaxID=2382161 RepID=UPI000F76081B|nr:Rad52/Rad22 family DNA repair protein [Halocella sp. SP3-1]AZO96174.1 recombinase [Halocella sp. SP3-1]
MDLEKLKEPLPIDEISWRVQSCGINSSGKPWAMVLAYKDARADMNRLDEVCGPGNWQRKHSFGNNGEILCSVGIKIGDEWVWKTDGAAQTNVEGEKGGLSDAFKRACVSWGIGRYLYNLTENFAECSMDKNKRYQDGWNSAKVTAKNNKQNHKDTWIYWKAPQLPSWALPNRGNSIDKIENSTLAAIQSYIKRDESAQNIAKKSVAEKGYSDWGGLKNYTQEEGENLLQKIESAVSAVL